MRLSDRHVVVTGAGGGIGGAIAVAAAREGASVSCVGRSAESLRATVSAIEQACGSAVSIIADLVDESAVQNALDESCAAFGHVDVLIAAAGGAGGVRAAFLDITPGQWASMLDRNLTSAFLCGSIFGRHMCANGKGSIVYISSQASQVVQPGMAHYSSSKGAIRQLVRAMALELGPLGVRVNDVAPGFTYTPANSRILDDVPQDAAVYARIPLGRFARPDEIAGAAIYLAGEEASFTNGASIPVDGGFTIC
jgi:NAD(P)-dependent dehydrogenase (short-subunit alcohol dehydrogenase family)